MTELIFLAQVILVGFSGLLAGWIIANLIVGLIIKMFQLSIKRNNRKTAANNALIKQYEEERNA